MVIDEVQKICDRRLLKPSIFEYCNLMTTTAETKKFFYFCTEEIVIIFQIIAEANVISLLPDKLNEDRFNKAVAILKMLFAIKHSCSILQLQGDLSSKLEKDRSQMKYTHTPAGQLTKMTHDIEIQKEIIKSVQTNFDKIHYESINPAANESSYIMQYYLWCTQDLSRFEILHKDLLSHVLNECKMEPLIALIIYSKHFMKNFHYRSSEADTYLSNPVDKQIDLTNYKDIQKVSAKLTKENYPKKVKECVEAVKLTSNAYADASKKVPDTKKESSNPDVKHAKPQAGNFYGPKADELLKDLKIIREIKNTLENNVRIAFKNASRPDISQQVKDIYLKEHATWNSILLKVKDVKPDIEQKYEWWKQLNYLKRKHSVKFDNEAFLNMKKEFLDVNKEKDKSAKHIPYKFYQPKDISTVNTMDLNENNIFQILTKKNDETFTLINKICNLQPQAWMGNLDDHVEKQKIDQFQDFICEYLAELPEFFSSEEGHTTDIIACLIEQINVQLKFMPNFTGFMEIFKSNIHKIIFSLLCSDMKFQLALLNQMNIQTFQTDFNDLKQKISDIDCRLQVMNFFKESMEDTDGSGTNSKDPTYNDVLIFLHMKNSEKSQYQIFHESIKKIKKDLLADILACLKEENCSDYFTYSDYSEWIEYIGLDLDFLKDSGEEEASAKIDNSLDLIVTKNILKFNSDNFDDNYMNFWKKEDDNKNKYNFLAISKKKNIASNTMNEEESFLHSYLPLLAFANAISQKGENLKIFHDKVYEMKNIFNNSSLSHLNMDEIEKIHNEIFNCLDTHKRDLESFNSLYNSLCLKIKENKFHAKIQSNSVKQDNLSYIQEKRQWNQICTTISRKNDPIVFQSITYDIFNCDALYVDDEIQILPHIKKWCSKIQQLHQKINSNVKCNVTNECRIILDKMYDFKNSSSFLPTKSFGALGTDSDDSEILKPHYKTKPVDMSFKQNIYDKISNLINEKGLGTVIEDQLELIITFLEETATNITTERGNEHVFQNLLDITDQDGGKNFGSNFKQKINDFTSQIEVELVNQLKKEYVEKRRNMDYFNQTYTDEQFENDCNLIKSFKNSFLHLEDSKSGKFNCNRWRIWKTSAESLNFTGQKITKNYFRDSEDETKYQKLMQVFFDEILKIICLHYADVVDIERIKETETLQISSEAATQKIQHMLEDVLLCHSERTITMDKNTMSFFFTEQLIHEMEQGTYIQFDEEILNLMNFDIFSDKKFKHFKQENAEQTDNIQYSGQSDYPVTESAIKNLISGFKFLVEYKKIKECDPLFENFIKDEIFVVNVPENKTADFLADNKGFLIRQKIEMIVNETNDKEEISKEDTQLFQASKIIQNLQKIPWIIMIYEHLYGVYYAHLSFVEATEERQQKFREYSKINNFMKEKQYVTSEFEIIKNMAEMVSTNDNKLNLGSKYEKYQKVKKFLRGGPRGNLLTNTQNLKDWDATEGGNYNEQFQFVKTAWDSETFKSPVWLQKNIDYCVDNNAVSRLKQSHQLISEEMDKYKNARQFSAVLMSSVRILFSNLKSLHSYGGNNPYSALNIHEGYGCYQTELNENILFQTQWSMNGEHSYLADCFVVKCLERLLSGVGFTVGFMKEKYNKTSGEKKSLAHYRLNFPQNKREIDGIGSALSFFRNGKCLPAKFNTRSEIDNLNNIINRNFKIYFMLQGQRICDYVSWHERFLKDNEENLSQEIKNISLLNNQELFAEKDKKLIRDALSMYASSVYEGLLSSDDSNFLFSDYSCTEPLLLSPQYIFLLTICPLDFYKLIYLMQYILQKIDSIDFSHQNTKSTMFFCNNKGIFFSKKNKIISFYNNLMEIIVREFKETSQQFKEKYWNKYNFDSDFLEKSNAKLVLMSLNEYENMIENQLNQSKNYDENEKMQECIETMKTTSRNISARENIAEFKIPPLSDFFDNVNDELFPANSSQIKFDLFKIKDFIGGEDFLASISKNRMKCLRDRIVTIRKKHDVFVKKVKYNLIDYSHDKFSGLALQHLDKNFLKSDNNFRNSTFYLDFFNTLEDSIQNFTLKTSFSDKTMAKSLFQTFLLQPEDKPTLTFKSLTVERQKDPQTFYYIYALFNYFITENYRKCCKVLYESKIFPQKVFTEKSQTFNNLILAKFFLSLQKDLFHWRIFNSNAPSHRSASRRSLKGIYNADEPHTLDTELDSCNIDATNSIDTMIKRAEREPRIRTKLWGVDEDSEQSSDMQTPIGSKIDTEKILQLTFNVAKLKAKKENFDDELSELISRALQDDEKSPDLICIALQEIHSTITAGADKRLKIKGDYSELLKGIITKQTNNTEYRIIVSHDYSKNNINRELTLIFQKWSHQNEYQFTVENETLDFPGTFNDKSAIITRLYLKGTLTHIFVNAHLPAHMDELRDIKIEGNTYKIRGFGSHYEARMEALTSILHNINLGLYKETSSSKCYISVMGDLNFRENGSSSLQTQASSLESKEKITLNKKYDELYCTLTGKVYVFDKNDKEHELSLEKIKKFKFLDTKNRADVMPQLKSMYDVFDHEIQNLRQSFKITKHHTYSHERAPALTDRILLGSNWRDSDSEKLKILNYKFYEGNINMDNSDHLPICMVVDIEQCKQHKDTENKSKKIQEIIHNNQESDSDLLAKLIVENKKLSAHNKELKEIANEALDSLSTCNR